MRMKYEFEMPETPYESNCRVCPFKQLINEYCYCLLQEDSEFYLIGLTEKSAFEKFMEMNMGCPLEVVK
jgi:hypothetical protein